MLALKTKIWSVKKKRNSFPDLWMAYQVLGIKWAKKIKIFKNSAFDKKKSVNLTEMFMTWIRIRIWIQIHFFIKNGSRIRIQMKWILGTGSNNKVYTEVYNLQLTLLAPVSSAISAE